MNATEPTTRRLFFALWPTAEVRRAIHDSCAGAVSASKGRPVPADNYHITLAFLGNQPADRFAYIVEAGHKVLARHPNWSAEMRLGRLRFWSRPQALLLVLSENPDILSLLADDLWSELELLGVTRDRRALLPHVTLSRKVVQAPEANLPSAVDWIARSFVLVESVTTSGGATYTVVAEFPRQDAP